MTAALSAATFGILTAGVAVATRNSAASGGQSTAAMASSVSSAVDPSTAPAPVTETPTTATVPRTNGAQYQYAPPPVSHSRGS